MIKSMTGFARSETQRESVRIVWELRSINHRYLDVQLKIPEGFRPIEQELRRIIAEGASRGKIDAGLTLQWGTEYTPATRLNMPFAKSLIGHLQTLASHIDKPAAVSPVAVLRWPGVLEEAQTDLEPVFPLASAGLERAIEDLRASRSREGANVQHMLEQRCVQVEELVGQVQARLPKVLQEIRHRLGERVKSLAAQPDQDRLELELAIMAQKLDVSEELERLLAHVAEVRTALVAGEPVGRRLDFLMQELNREANTLASKSADPDTTRHAVDLKVFIEQMREQVQNVE
jgi:uncharacterized protein (TIGR00255 family)